METTRQTILDQASRLAASEGEVPSLNALASAVGISKGGLMHHFHTRNALLTALAEDGILAVETALNKAVSEKNVLRTWLELSLPDSDGVALFQSMASVFFAGKSDQGEIQTLASEANQRWEALLQQELGSAVAAKAARLLGDGLLLGSISGSITSSNSRTYFEAAQAAVGAMVEVSR